MPGVGRGRAREAKRAMDFLPFDKNPCSESVKGEQGLLSKAGERDGSFSPDGVSAYFTLP